MINFLSFHLFCKLEKLFGQAKIETTKKDRRSGLAESRRKEKLDMSKKNVGLGVAALAAGAGVAALAAKNHKNTASRKEREAIT